MDTRGQAECSAPAFGARPAEVEPVADRTGILEAEEAQLAAAIASGSDCGDAKREAPGRAEAQCGDARAEMEAPARGPPGRLSLTLPHARNGSAPADTAFEARVEGARLCPGGRRAGASSGQARRASVAGARRALPGRRRPGPARGPRIAGREWTDGLMGSPIWRGFMGRDRAQRGSDRCRGR